MTTKTDSAQLKSGENEEVCNACKIRRCLVKIATRMKCKGFESVMIREARDLLGIVDGEYQDA